MQGTGHWHWLRWRGRLMKWLHPTELQGTLFWAALVGCVGGFSAIGFRDAIQAVLWAFTRHGGGIAKAAAALAWWQRFLIPAAGGLAAGVVLHFGGRLRRGHRSSDYMEAVGLRRGVMSVRQGLTKTSSSLLTIGSGGSIGREGAMVQLAATVASWLGQRGELSTPRLRLVVACGAAGGLAAVYDVTVAGALFVAEIVLGSIAVESLGPLLLAAWSSSMVSRYVGGAHGYFHSPPVRLESPWELLAYLAMGVGLGAAAPGYVWLLRRSEDLFTRLAPHVYWRMALGGLAMGALAIPFPEVWGNGRSTIDSVLTTCWTWQALAAVLVFKALATAATTGSGAVGGVFTPTLFTGALLGCLFGHLVNGIVPGAAGSPQSYAVAGMAGFLSAASRAPLTAILMLTEMTLDYGVVLPIMLVSVIGYYTARSLQSDSIYSEALRRKQPPAAPADPAALRVRDLMKPPALTVLESAPFGEIAQLFASQPYRHVLVVTLQNRLRGIIALREVEDLLERDEPVEWVKAAGLMRTDLRFVTPDSRLRDALEAFHQYRGERLPVVNDLEERVLLGSISKTDVLLTLAHGLDGKPAQRF